MWRLLDFVVYSQHDIAEQVGGHKHKIIYVVTDVTSRD